MPFSTSSSSKRPRCALTSEREMFRRRPIPSPRLRRGTGAARPVNLTTIFCSREPSGSPRSERRSTSGAMIRSASLTSSSRSVKATLLHRTPISAASNPNAGTYVEGKILDSLSADLLYVNRFDSRINRRCTSPSRTCNAGYSSPRGVSNAVDEKTVCDAPSSLCCTSIQPRLTDNCRSRSADGPSTISPSCSPFAGALNIRPMIADLASGSIPRHRTPLVDTSSRRVNSSTSAAGVAPAA